MVQTEKELIEIFKSLFECKGQDLCWKKGVHKGKVAGYIVKSGHRMLCITLSPKKYLKIFAHKVVFAIFHGFIPDIVDHKDRNPLNNNIDNLRLADKQLNSINRNPPKNNKTGFKGVSYRPKLKVYHAQIKVNQVKKHLGTFKNIEDAIRARKSAEKLYWSDI